MRPCNYLQAVQGGRGEVSGPAFQIEDDDAAAAIVAQHLEYRVWRLIVTAVSISSRSAFRSFPLADGAGRIGGPSTGSSRLNNRVASASRVLVLALTSRAFRRRPRMSMLSKTSIHFSLVLGPARVRPGQVRHRKDDGG